MVDFIGTSRAVQKEAVQRLDEVRSWVGGAEKLVGSIGIFRGTEETGCELFLRAPLLQESHPALLAAGISRPAEELQIEAIDDARVGLGRMLDALGYAGAADVR